MSDRDRSKRTRRGIIGLVALVVAVGMLAPVMAGAIDTGTAPAALQANETETEATTTNNTSEIENESTPRKALETETTAGPTDTDTGATSPAAEATDTATPAAEATDTATPTRNVTPAFDEDWRIDPSLNESQMQNMSKSQLVERIQSLQRVLEVSEDQYIQRIIELQVMLDQQREANASNASLSGNASGAASVAEFENASGQANATAQPTDANASGNETNATVIRLEGTTPGWVGMSPDSINGTTNPTLNLTAGERYTIQWVNTDGEPHNVVIRSSEGEQLVRSPVVAEQGATQNVTFTATENMSTYLCELHPTSMVGDVSVSGNGSANASADNATAVRGPSG